MLYVTRSPYLLVGQHEVQSRLVSAFRELIANKRPTAFALCFHNVIWNDSENVTRNRQQKQRWRRRAFRRHLLGRFVVRITDFGRVRSVVQYIRFRSHGYEKKNATKLKDKNEFNPNNLMNKCLASCK